MSEEQQEQLVAELKQKLPECVEDKGNLRFKTEWKPVNLSKGNKQKFVKSQGFNKNGPPKKLQEEFRSDPNCYLNYINPIVDEETNSAHKIKYTMHITRAVFSDEIFEVFKKYELAVHKKEREPDFFKRNYCNSPVYDPNFDTKFANTQSECEFTHIDKLKGYTNADQGVFPEANGTYHIQHRLDGKLVALSVFDILEKMVYSAYFVYDVDYKFLNLGVVGTIREIEWMAKARENGRPNLKQYILGDLMINVVKTIYKISYQPGYIVCPRTNGLVPWSKEVKQQLKNYGGMRLNEKERGDLVQVDTKVTKFQKTKRENSLICFDNKEESKVRILQNNAVWMQISDFSENGKIFLNRYCTRSAFYFSPALDRKKWIMEYKAPVVDVAAKQNAFYLRRKKIWSRFEDIDHPICNRNHAEMVWVECREMDFGYELVPGQPCELCTKPGHFDYYGCKCDEEIREDTQYDEYMKDVDTMITCKTICEDCWVFIKADMEAL